MPESAFSALVAAPGFALGVRCAEAAVIGIRFLPPQAAVSPPTTALAAEAARQLAAWLADPRQVWDLPMRATGTDFQRRVWAAIAAIPLGQTRTYGQLAQTLASSPRAVGNACGKNPLPILVPCHRVVGATGLGGFDGHRDGFLLDVKRWLLHHEGIPC
jgi:methylated-DNA-[protein]-cysteine S-methyltransferase